MTELQAKRIFSQEADSLKEKVQAQLAAACVFDEAAFVAQESEHLKQVPNQAGYQHQKISSRWLMLMLLIVVGLMVSALLALQDSLQTGRYFPIFWSLFAALFLGVVGYHLSGQIRRIGHLNRQLDYQTQAAQLATQTGNQQGRDFCHEVAKANSSIVSSEAYQQWKNSLAPHHNDAEVLALFDRIVLSQQDHKAKKLIAEHASEVAVLVAISPLVWVDMALVAWRSLRLMDQLAALYGVRLTLWSRWALLKKVFVAMAVAGASELALDQGMELLSLTVASKLSVRVGQGVGVGLLTARLGIKTVEVLRPIAWQAENRLTLSDVRQQIVSKITALVIKPASES